MSYLLKMMKKQFQLLFANAVLLAVSNLFFYQTSFAQELPFKIKLLDVYNIPHNLNFGNTTVGGLSGIDYDADKEVYYAISDDRSDINPARFYTFKIDINRNKIDTVYFVRNTFLKNANGQYFPPSRSKNGTVDPEALRKWGQYFIWSSEGERIERPDDTVFVNPGIFLADSLGNYIDTFLLPKQVLIENPYSGVRKNGGFEGLAISPDHQFLYASVEEPLLQDGPRAGIGDSSGIIRIIKYDIQTKKSIAQYAYKIEPVAHPVFPPNAFRVNGISDILCLSDKKFLVVERSYSTGRLTCTIKVFITDLSQADDIASYQSLLQQDYHLAPKELLLNMDNLGIFIDNIEGVTFGPILANGKRSLIFIADNNFNGLEKSQILLFEIEDPD